MKYSEFYKEHEKLINKVNRIGGLRYKELGFEGWPEYFEHGLVEKDGIRLIEETDSGYSSHWVPAIYLDLTTDEEIQSELQREKLKRQKEKAEYEESLRQKAEARRLAEEEIARANLECERKEYERLKAKFEPNGSSAQIEQLKNELRGMITSYDLLVGERSPFRNNEIALGIIRGLFHGIDEARELLKE